MKKPSLADFPTGTPKPTKTENPKGKIVGKSDNKRAVKRSFTISPEQSAYIDKYALEEGQKRGKSMTASEALRLIINKAQEKL